MSEKTRNYHMDDFPRFIVFGTPNGLQLAELAAMCCYDRAGLPVPRYDARPVPWTEGQNPHEAIRDEIERRSR